MNRTIQTAVMVVLAVSAFAAPQSFDFKDPKGVNNVIFKTDAVLESINGASSNARLVMTDGVVDSVLTASVASSLTVTVSLSGTGCKSMSCSTVASIWTLNFFSYFLKPENSTVNMYSPAMRPGKSY